MKYNAEQRKALIEQAKGKTISDMHYVEEDELMYWVVEFTDGTEMCVKLMAELV